MRFFGDCVMSFSLPVAAAWLVASAFGLSAILHLAGLRALKDMYERWDYRRNSHRVIGVLNAITAAFLAIPQTRLWGVALAAAILFGAVVALLNRRQYLYAIPGMLLLAALPSAFISSAV
jgi:hypothetical protein